MIKIEIVPMQGMRHFLWVRVQDIKSFKPSMDGEFGCIEFIDGTSAIVGAENSKQVDKILTKGTQND